MEDVTGLEEVMGSDVGGYGILKTFSGEFSQKFRIKARESKRKKWRRS
jgi:hypothetical protein